MVAGRILTEVTANFTGKYAQNSHGILDEIRNIGD
jgi:hypothetical protein